MTACRSLAAKGLRAKGLGAAFAVTIGLPLLAGCGAGTHNETQHEVANHLASGNAGLMAVRGAQLVPSAAASTSPSAAATLPVAPAASTSPSASASASITASPSPSSSAAPSAQGYLLVVLVNNAPRPDALINVSILGGSVQPANSSATDLVVPPHQSVRFGDPDLGFSGPALAISGLTSPLQPGRSMQVVLQFRSAGSVTIDVPVAAADSVGTTATSAPIQTTGSYPSASATPTAAL